MAIGSSIDYSIPAVGVTVSSVSKLADGQFAEGDYFTDGNGNDVPLLVTLRPCSLNASNKTVGISLSFNPGIHNTALGADQGKCTVTINCAFRNGVSVDTDEAKALLNYAMSVLTTATVQTALFGGSTE
jgi:hypothetical protein